MFSFQPLINEAKNAGLISAKEVNDLPTLPTDPLEWIRVARPYVGKIKRTFEWEPFWIEPYKDKSPNVVLVNGRQSFKSTFGTDIIGCYATSHEDVEVTYVCDRQDRAGAWSKQRFRKDTMQKNDLLYPFLYNGRANVGEINLTNDSVVYVRTDESEYNNVQGMTNWCMVYDECQYQELQFRVAALYSMTMTKGQVYYLGIGGEQGSEWEKIWNKSDQKHWKFDDKNWRQKLKFDDEGYLCNEHPENIVSGKWIADYPEHKEYSGYTMPQTIFARIPLTIKDAIELYKTRPENSVEFQEKYNPKSIVAAHVHGKFFKALRRPVTPEMVEACYDYTLSYLTGEEVKRIKAENLGQVIVYLGIDWGSGPSASKTVGAVIIYWKKTNRYQIAFIDSRPMEHEYNQAAHFVKIFNEFGCDSCLADLGYGKDKVTLMQNGGFHADTGEKFAGLGSGRVMGAWSSGNLTEENMRQKAETLVDKNKVGVKKAYYSLDKTQIIQNFVDVLGTTVPNELGKPVSQLILPMKNDECAFLVNEFCDLTRKDLDKNNQEIITEDARQKPKKEWNHPRDVTMAIIYVLENNRRYDANSFGIQPIAKTGMGINSHGITRIRHRTRR